MADIVSERRPPARGPRKDVERNRAAVVQAARNAIAHRGVSVPTAAIARAAGLGTATLYRHFPTREALLAAVFDAEVHRCEASLDRALTHADPRRGLMDSLDEFITIDIAAPHFVEAFLTSSAGSITTADSRRRAAVKLDTLARRLREIDAVDDTFGIDDINLIIVSLHAVISLDRTRARERATRLLAHLSAGYLKS